MRREEILVFSRDKVGKRTPRQRGAIRLEQIRAVLVDVDDDASPVQDEVANWSTLEEGDLIYQGLLRHRVLIVLRF